MSYIHETELPEILSKLPDIKELDLQHFPKMDSNSIFIAILGFEDRCLSIPEELADRGGYKAKTAYYFTYTTNSEDNKKNKDRLLAALSEISSSGCLPIMCDDQDFPRKFKEIISRYKVTSEHFTVVLDISSCSSMPLLIALQILFEFDIDLHILYSEAKIYHPTLDEWTKEKDKHIKEDGFGIAKGVGNVLPSPVHPGDRKDNLPEKIFVFPTFKPERVIAILQNIDPSIAIAPNKHVTWFVGQPHLKENEWRIDAVKEVNKISNDMQHILVSTFNYKDTINTLNNQWDKLKDNHHITIAPLVSCQV